MAKQQPKPKAPSKLITVKKGKELIDSLNTTYARKMDQANRLDVRDPQKSGDLRVQAGRDLEKTIQIKEAIERAKRKQIKK